MTKPKVTDGTVNMRTGVINIILQIKEKGAAVICHPYSL